MNVRVTVEAIVKPTEDESKVQRALFNIFPESKVQRINKQNFDVLRIQGTGINFLAAFRNLIRQERIRSVARRIFMEKARGERIQIFLHKQAAYVGRVSFCAPEGESPLGPISIDIVSDSMLNVVDYLTGEHGFQRFRET